ncbi:polysaccharide biosynthesis C-terminal domain-containing protein [Oscillospiraceae bacterium PP1C4]
MKKTKLFLLNALIMTITSLLLSSVGVWFNLYISNKIGAAGMGIFQLMMSVYTMAVTLAASGIHFATTRMIAEETLASGAGAKSAMRRCLLYSFIFGCVAAAALYFGAPSIGLRWLGTVETIRPLKAMAFSMPFIAFSCALNGYFTAVRRVVKSAASQILEQSLRIVLTIIGLNYFVPEGLEYACFAITCAGVIAEGLSCLFEFVLYLIDSRRYKSNGVIPEHLTRRLLNIALPVAFSSYLRSGLSTIKNLLVPIRLQVGGLSSSDALSVFGVVHGIALPVILFPYAFFTAFNSLIVPELAQYHSQNRNANSLIQKMFSMTLCFSLGICGILFCFSYEIGAAVSQNSEVGTYIRLLAPIIPIMYLDTAVDNMLKGINEQVSVMRYNIIDALLSVAGVYLLLPVLGIKGYLFVICGSEVFNFWLSLNRLISVTKVHLNITEWVVKPLLCIAIAILSVEILFALGSFAFPMLVQTAIMVSLSGVIYLLLIHLSGCIKLI